MMALGSEELELDGEVDVCFGRLGGVEAVVVEEAAEDTPELELELVDMGKTVRRRFAREALVSREELELSGAAFSGGSSVHNLL
jgi:hypothetical protein